MKLHSFRPRILALWLAFVAVLGMNAVSAYHNMLPHDDGHVLVEASASEHLHDPTDDHDGLAHQTMHEVVHGVSMPQVAGLGAERPVVAGDWSIGVMPVFKGSVSSTILRPPQA